MEFMILHCRLVYIVVSDCISWDEWHLEGYSYEDVEYDRYLGINMRDT